MVTRICTAIPTLGLALILGLPYDGLAQSAEAGASQFELDVHASAHRFGSPQLGDRQDYGLGARVLYGVTRGLGFGIGLGWLRDEFSARFVDDPNPTQFVQDLYFYGGEMEYAFRPGNNIQPFLGLGFGAVSIHSEARSADVGSGTTETFPFAPATAGLLWLDHAENPGFGLRIGIRDNLVWYGDGGSRVIRPDDGAHHNLEFLAGIALFPGGMAGP